MDVVEESSRPQSTAERLAQVPRTPPTMFCCMACGCGCGGELSLPKSTAERLVQVPRTPPTMFAPWPMDVEKADLMEI